MDLLENEYYTQLINKLYANDNDCHQAEAKRTEEANLFGEENDGPNAL